MTEKSQTKKKTLKLLVIAPYCIVPADTGGKIRVFELANGVSEHGISVTVVMPMTPARFSRKNIKINLTLEVVPYPFILPLLFTDKPFSYLYLISHHPGYHLLMKKFLRTYDIIQFEGVCFADLIRHIPQNKIVVYDAHNVEYDYARSESCPQWVRSISVKRIHKFEKLISQRANHIFSCSDSDAERIAGLYDISRQKFTVVPNGINLHEKIPKLTIEQVRDRFSGLFDFPQRAIFSGSDVEHNRAAVRFLIESVAPHLRKECAFIIQGQCGNRFKNQQGKNVFFDPVPGKVGTYVEVCTVALNPVSQGSGTSLKVLDYFVNGLPVISTEFGMRGYEDLKEYVTLTDQNNFVETLKSNVRFPEEVKNIIEKYSWKSIAGTAYQKYISLLDEKQT